MGISFVRPEDVPSYPPEATPLRTAPRRDASRRGHVPRPPFELRLSTVSNAVIVSVRGEIDLSTAQQLDDALLAATKPGGTRVVVDMSGCDFLDSSGLHVLAKAHKRLNGANPFSIVVSDRNVLKVFEVTKLNGLFTIHPTRDAAVRGKTT